MDTEEKKPLPTLDAFIIQGSTGNFENEAVFSGTDVRIGGNVTILPGIVIDRNVLNVVGMVDTKDVLGNCGVDVVPAES